MAVARFKSVWTLEKVSEMSPENVRRMMASESLHKLAQRAIQEMFSSGKVITTQDGFVFAGAYPVLIGHEDMLEQKLPIREHCVAFAKFARSLIEAFERDDMETFQRDFPLLQAAYDLQKALTLQFGLFNVAAPVVDHEPANRRNEN